MSLVKVVNEFVLRRFESNQLEEQIQKIAWRLVRSAEDRLKGPKRGAERLIWCVDMLRKEVSGIEGTAEDFIRAAFVQFKTETS